MEGANIERLPECKLFIRFFFRFAAHHEEIAILTFAMMKSYWTPQRWVDTIMTDAPVREIWRAE